MQQLQRKQSSLARATVRIIDRSAFALAVIIVIAFTLAHTAHATQRTFEFQGTIISSSKSGVSVGDPFVATLSYDDAEAPYASGSGVAQYNGYTYTLTVAGQIFTKQPSGYLSVGNSSQDWIYIGDALPQLKLSLTDNTATAFSSTALPASLSLANFSNDHRAYWSETLTINFVGNITSITSVHTFVVVNTNDAGAGSLRAAIENANVLANINSATPDTIVFNIPGSGPHTIAPTVDLPTIVDPVIIDGYSQPGASENTFAVGNNAVLKIILSDCPTDGPKIAAGNSTVQGLVINQTVGAGIYLYVNGNNTIRGNFIGTDVTGTVDLGNISGIDMVSSNNTIGGAAPGDRNIISGNRDYGVHILGLGTDSNTVAGNYIGTDASGILPIANGLAGVKIAASNNTIGGTDPNSGNTIAFNGGKGVFVESGTGNAIDPNSIFGNGGLGIDLGTAGVTPNDAGDADAGPNNLQNFPEMTQAQRQNNGDLSVTYSVPSAVANSTYPLRIEFFKALGGEGKTFIGAQSYTSANAELTITQTFTPDAAVSIGDTLVATATDTDGNTSEFSASAVVTSSAPPFTAYITSLDTTVYLFGPFRPGTTLTAHGSNGVEPYSYLWSTGQTDQSIIVFPKFPSQTYTVRVVDASQDTATDDITIYVKDIRCGSGKAKICYNGATLCVPLGKLNSYVNRGATLGPCLAKAGVPDEVATIIPDQFSLEQNYPNPFNPSTTIEYALPIDARVTLGIYDVLGRLVAELVNGQVAAGYHVVSFDAAHLSSGIYFYRLNADEGNGKRFTQIRKLMLMK